MPFKFNLNKEENKEDRGETPPRRTAGPRHSSKRLTMSADTIKVYDTIKHLYWPNGSDQDLPYCLELSMKRYTKFRQRWKLIEGNLTKVDPLLTEHLQHLFTPPIDFIRGYFREIQHDLEGWKDWRGRLESFSVHSDRFLRWGREWTYDFCYKSERFDRLLEVYNRGN